MDLRQRAGTFSGAVIGITARRDRARKSQSGSKKKRHPEVSLYGSVTA